MLPGLRTLLLRLVDRHPVAIVSGRSLDKLLEWVKVQGLYFAASHGFEIIGPHGSALNYTVAHELLPTIQEALAVLQVLPAALPTALLPCCPAALLPCCPPFRRPSPRCRRSWRACPACSSRTCNRHVTAM